MLISLSSLSLQRRQEDSLAAMVLVRRFLNSPGRAVRVRLRGQQQAAAAAMGVSDGKGKLLGSADAPHATIEEQRDGDTSSVEALHGQDVEMRENGL